MSNRPNAPSSLLRLSHVFALITLLLAFSSGYLYGQTDAAQGHNAFESVLRLVGINPMRSGLFAVLPPGTTLEEADRQRLRVFWESWILIDREFFPRESVDHQQMVYGAIKGMLETLRDPNTVFLTPANRDIADAELRGTFDGVGIQVDVKDGRLRVTAPIDGTPAQQAGILPGDIIVQIDDRDVRSANLNDVVLLIRGPRGTNVALTVEREGVTEPIRFAMTRAEIRMQAVRGRMIGDDIAYLRVASFSSTAPGEAASRLRELMGQQPKGLVIDLRSNPGGYLHSTVELTSQFLDDGVIVYQRNAGGDEQDYRSKGGGVATTIPLVVLVNRGTASAAEITAAALRDNGRAVLVGERTFGKGTVQSVRQLSDRSGLRITSAQWLTPNRQPIHGEGLEPDIAVTQLAPAVTGADSQLDAAVSYLFTSRGDARAGSPTP